MSVFNFPKEPYHDIKAMVNRHWYGIFLARDIRLIGKEKLCTFKAEGEVSLRDLESFKLALSAF